jgi:hypothetical protein
MWLVFGLLVGLTIVAGLTMMYRVFRGDYD